MIGDCAPPEVRLHRERKLSVAPAHCLHRVRIKVGLPGCRIGFEV